MTSCNMLNSAKKGAGGSNCPRKAVYQWTDFRPKKWGRLVYVGLRVLNAPLMMLAFNGILVSQTVCC